MPGFRPGTFINVAEFCSKNEYDLYRKRNHRTGLHQQVAYRPGHRKKRQVQGVWEPIIDVDLFNRVQAARRKARAFGGSTVNRAVSRHFYLLSKILFCRFCGREMEATRSGTGVQKPLAGKAASRKGPKKNYYYYK